MKETYKLLARSASGKTQELLAQLIRHDGGWVETESHFPASAVRSEPPQPLLPALAPSDVSGNATVGWKTVALAAGPQPTGRRRGGKVAIHESDRCMGNKFSCGRLKEIFHLQHGLLN